MHLSRLIRFGRRSKHVVVDIGASSVKLATVTVDHGSSEQTIAGITIVPLPPGSVWNGWLRDQTAVTRAIKGYVQRQGLTGAAAVTAVPGRAIMIKTLELSSMNIVDLETTVEFQAMELIPANLDDVFLDYHVTRENEENNQLTVLLAAAKKTLVQSYMEVLAKAGLLPRIVDVDYFALQNLCQGRHAKSDDQTVCVVHIGASVTTLTILEKGVALFFGDLQTAGRTFTERIAASLGVAFAEAETLKTSHPMQSEPEGLAALIPCLCEEFAHELQRTISRFIALNGNLRIDRLLICGGGARLPGLQAKLWKEFHGSVRLCEAFEAADNSHDELPPEFAVVGGLAMRKPWQR